MAKGVPPPDLDPDSLHSHEPFVLRSPVAPDGFEGGPPPSPLRHRHSFQAFPAARDPFADPALLRAPAPVEDAVKLEIDHSFGQGAAVEQVPSSRSRRRRLILLFAIVIVLLFLIIGLSAGLATRNTVTTREAAAAAADRSASASSVSAKSASAASVKSASKAFAAEHPTSSSKAHVTTSNLTSESTAKTTSKSTSIPQPKSSGSINAASSRQTSTLRTSSSSHTATPSSAFASTHTSSTRVSVKAAASPGSSGQAGSSGSSGNAGNAGNAGSSGSSGSPGSSGSSGLPSNPPTPTSTIVYGTYKAALLARSSFMTRAPLPTLALPSQPLATASAISFIESQWNYIGGLTTPSFVTFEQDPYVGNGTVMAVDYPPGSEGGGSAGTAGGIESLMLGVFGKTSQQRSIISYKVAFSENFDFVNGGKLPGVYGGNGTCSGGIRNPDCFSARLMWRAGGVGEVYCYIPEYNGLSTDALEGGNTTLTKRAFGLSLNTATWNFTTTGWNEIIQVVVLNSNPGPVGPADGYLAMYHNGYLAFERSDLVYRTDPTVGIDQFFFSTFFGGSGSNFWASLGGKSYFKDFEFFSGTRASHTFGPNVTATFPANQ